MNADSAGPRGRLSSPKVRPIHLDRRAVVYVRQSTPQQVAENTESTARQYALADRAVALGWAPAEVEVIDEDQGRSGATVEGRPGFQRLLAEIGLDRVGLALGLEMSRLARSCKDWHQLVELCGLFCTLLADADGVYDPTDPNDRMLLGLRGMMSEAELHVLQSRMHEGKLNKARRGELFGTPPIGYVKLPTGEFAIDPDEQVRAVVGLIFDEFDRQGSLHGLLRYLTHHGIRIPIRAAGGPDRGRIEWRRPVRETLQNLLHNPTYAGIYQWGRSRSEPLGRSRSRPGRRAYEDREPIVIEGHLPAYITAERFRANQERLAANRARADAPGARATGRRCSGGSCSVGDAGGGCESTTAAPAGTCGTPAAGDDVVRGADLPVSRRAGPGRVRRRAGPGGVDAGRAGGQLARGRGPAGRARPVDRPVGAASGAGPLPVPARRAAVPGV